MFFLISYLNHKCFFKTEGRGCDCRSGFGVDVGRGRLVDRRLSLGESSKRSKAQLVSPK
jgi:hypothetical protein